MRCLHCLRLLLGTVVLAYSVGHAGEKTQEIKGWGKAVDPEGDCEFLAGAGKLTIKVPAGYHDFHPGPDYKANGPRVLREVDGDFTVEVRVSGTLPPDKDTALAGKASSFRAGTLLIWQDDKNFVRLDRAGMIKDGKLFNFAYYHVFKNAERPFSTGPLLKDDVTVLKAQRKGNAIHAWAIQGSKTITLPVQQVDLPARVQVGVGAINASKQALEVHFDKLSLTGGKK